MRIGRKVLFAVALLCALAIVVFLDILVNESAQEQSTARRALEEKEKYNGYGLPKGMELSNHIIYEDKKEIWYEDRVLRHFSDENMEQRAELIRWQWMNFSDRIPKGVKIWIVLLPERILYEAGYEEDKEQYDRFINLMKQEFQEPERILNLYQEMAIHKDEYIFYRKNTGITNRGGYYAAQALLERMGEDKLPKLSAYREELYPAGETVTTGEKNRKEQMRSLIPEDLTYLYEFPGSKNCCEVFSVENGERLREKRPTISKSGLRSGSVIKNGKFSWAVVEGDDQKGSSETLLLIGDRTAKSMIPFLANYYAKVYYIPVEWNESLGSEEQPVEDLFFQYTIKNVVFAQTASQMGDEGYSPAMRHFR